VAAEPAHANAPPRVVLPMVRSSFMCGRVHPRVNQTACSGVAQHVRVGVTPPSLAEPKFSALPQGRPAGVLHSRE
jgi:hypothetical protein